MSYSVWVGGVEINDIQSKREAEAIAYTWKLDGYDDVQIEEVDNGSIS